MRTLWQSAHPCRAEGPRPWGGPRSYRKIDAPSRHQGHHGAATADAHHRQPSRLPDRGEPARSELHRRCAEPDLACRHHLRRDRPRLALSGHHHGPVQPQDRGLGDGGSFARRPAAGCLADGHLGAAAWRRPDPPFRSGRSICLGGVSQNDAVCRLQGLDESQGRLFMDFFVPNGGGGLTAPFHLTFGVSPSSVLTYTLHRDCLHNADDPGMRWQIEGGKVLEHDKHVANYSSVKRVSCGTTEQNTAQLWVTLFFLGGKPPENMTLHGAHDFHSGGEIGSVSAASTAFLTHIGKQFERVA